MVKSKRLRWAEQLIVWKLDGGVDWIDLIQGGKRWRAIVNAAFGPVQGTGKVGAEYWVGLQMGLEAFEMGKASCPWRA